MLDDHFLVVTRHQTSLVSKKEFQMLMSSLGIKVAIQEKNGIQDLYVIKDHGQTLISNSQSDSLKSCFTGTDGVYLATSLIQITKQVRSIWTNLISLAQLIPEMKLLSGADTCKQSLNLNNPDLSQLYKCTKEI